MSFLGQENTGFGQNSHTGASSESVRSMMQQESFELNWSPSPPSHLAAHFTNPNDQDVVLPPIFVPGPYPSQPNAPPVLRLNLEPSLGAPWDGIPPVLPGYNNPPFPPSFPVPFPPRPTSPGSCEELANEHSASTYYANHGPLQAERLVRSSMASELKRKRQAIAEVEAAGAAQKLAKKDADAAAKKAQKAAEAAEAAAKKAENQAQKSAEVAANKAANKAKKDAEVAAKKALREDEMAAKKAQRAQKQIEAAAMKAQKVAAAAAKKEENARAKQAAKDAEDAAKKVVNRGGPKRTPGDSDDEINAAGIDPTANDADVQPVVSTRNWTDEESRKAVSYITSAQIWRNFKLKRPQVFKHISGNVLLGSKTTQQVANLL